MKRGDVAKLKMKKMLRVGENADTHDYICRVVKCDVAEGYIYLVLENERLESISLDAIYYCEIETDAGAVTCTGRVRNRYCSDAGKTVKFEIENGFYKINIKYVDKQMA